MSLVAYGSSDESENEDEVNEQVSTEKNKPQELPVQIVNSKLQLPSPISAINNINDKKEDDLNDKKLNFDTLPKPKPVEIDNDYIIEDTDNKPVPKKVNYDKIEKPSKKEKGPAKISIPSLADFKDLDEESENSHNKRIPSQKGSGLIAILPPPKGSTISTKSNSMVPHVLTKKPTENIKPAQIKTAASATLKRIQKTLTQTKSTTSTLKCLSNYNSDSEDEDDKHTSSGMDFFSLSTPTKVSIEHLPSMESDDINNINASSSSNDSNTIEENVLIKEGESNTTLVSNVMNLPKEEIILKNKAEVGPKLPIPEQEYNVDSQGNVAFDEKAIEYLCGKRGVKRKNEFNKIDIVEIKGEDLKPDERDWLVKALTEEPVGRPVSAGAGPSGQSKKKHQITYLAHQAKAMELELKNQWAQNKSSRQQTRSKYGF